MIIGGGLVGVELFGELTAFVDGITPLYQHVNRDEVRFILLQGGDRIMPEIDPKLADYGARVLGGRRGADIRTHTIVRAIEPGKVHLAGRNDRSGDHCPGSGDRPQPGRGRACPWRRTNAGTSWSTATMRCQSHPEVWALGDCALDPRPRRQALPQPGPARLARGQGAGPKHLWGARRPAAPAVRLRTPWE